MRQHADTHTNRHMHTHGHTHTNRHMHTHGHTHTNRHITWTHPHKQAHHMDTPTQTYGVTLYVLRDTEVQNLMVQPMCQGERHQTRNPDVVVPHINILQHPALGKHLRQSYGSCTDQAQPI